MNTIEFLLKARDEASEPLKTVGEEIETVGEKAKKSSAVTLENFNKLTTAAGQGFDALTGNYSELGNVIGALPGPIAAVTGQFVGAVGEMIESTIKQADAYDKLSQKTGASIEFLSEFTEAADDVRVSSDTVARGLEVFSRKLGGVETAEDGAVEGSKKLVDALKDMGVVLPTAEDGAVDLEAAMMAVADQFKAMPDGAQKTALAVQLFGKAGAELIPILNKGSEEIKAMGDEAKALGLTFSRDTVDAAKMLLAQQDALGDQWTAMQTQVGKSLIPALLTLTSAMNATTIAASENAEQYKGVDRLLMNMVTSGKTWIEVLDGTREAQDKANVVASQAAKDAEKALVLFQKNKEAADAKTAALDKSTAAELAAQGAQQSNATAADRAAEAYHRNAIEVAAQEAATRAATAGQLAYKAGVDAAKLANDGLIASVNSSIEPLTKQERLTWLLKIATGEATTADLALESAKRAVMKASMEGAITEERTIELLKGLYNGTLSAKDAMERAGPAAQAIRNSYAEVATAAQTGADKADKLTDAITRVPKETKVVISTDANKGPVDSYTDAINRIPRNVTSTITTVHRNVYTADPAPGDNGSNTGSTPAAPRGGKEPSLTSVRVGGTTINVNGANVAAVARRIASNNAAIARGAALAAAYGGI